MPSEEEILPGYKSSGFCDKTEECTCQSPICGLDKECSFNGGGCYPPGSKVPEGAEDLGWCDKKTGCKCYKATNGTKTITTRAGMRVDQMGGWGGGYWTDLYRSSYGGDITRIEIRSHHYIVAIRARYGNVWGNWHGGSGHSFVAYDLSPGEKIRTVVGRSGSYVDALGFITDRSRVLSQRGGGGGVSRVKVQDGCYLKYFSGQTGSLVDQLKMHWQC